MCGNYGMTVILQGIASGKWDPSEVVYDLTKLYRMSDIFGPEDERQKLYEEIAKIVREKGVVVKMADLTRRG